MLPPPLQNGNRWSEAAGAHPNAHDANHMGATGLTTGSCCPPQPPQQVMMSQQWDGISYQTPPYTYNANPLHATRLPGSYWRSWPPQPNISQPCNGVPGGYQDHSLHTHGVNQQNHGNAAGYCPSVSVSQNQQGAANFYSGGYGHYGAPAPKLGLAWVRSVPWTSRRASAWHSARAVARWVRRHGDAGMDATEMVARSMMGNVIITLYCGTC